jgi:hypothetical protein
MGDLQAGVRTLRRASGHVSALGVPFQNDEEGSGPLLVRFKDNCP